MYFFISTFFQILIVFFINKLLFQGETKYSSTMIVYYFWLIKKDLDGKHVTEPLLYILLIEGHFVRVTVTAKRI